MIYHKLIRQFGIERAQMYLHANAAALEEYRTLCRKIDCDFEEKTAFVYTLDDRRALEQELSALDALHFRAQYAQRLPLPFSTAGAVKFSNQAQFHPLKFAYAIEKELNLYEHTPVLELTEHGAVTKHGTIRAEKTIVATHFPFLNRHGSYFLKQYQHRSYVIALENAANVDGMYVDASKTGLSFRSAQNLLLLWAAAATAPASREETGVSSDSLCQKTLPLQRSISLGGTGLHDAGRRPLYRTVFQAYGKSLCGYRLQ